MSDDDAEVREVLAMLVGRSVRGAPRGYARSLVDRSVTADVLVDERDRLAGLPGYPAVLRCDNGPELACETMSDWAGKRVEWLRSPNLRSTLTRHGSVLAGRTERGRIAFSKFGVRSDAVAKTYISIPEAPECDPGYAQAVKAGNTIYVHGTTGFDVAADEYPPTIRDQTRQALANCRAILAAAGADLGDVVMVTTLLQRSDDASVVSEVFAEFFPEMEPPRCVARIGVDRPGLLISIAMVAVID